MPGETDASGRPVPGCTPPCLQGQQGYRDGNLTYAQFHKPTDIARGVNGSFLITDSNRVRLLDPPEVVTEISGVYSKGRISTLAGTGMQGREDGLADDATFFEPIGDPASFFIY